MEKKAVEKVRQNNDTIKRNTNISVLKMPRKRDDLFRKNGKV